MNDFTKGEWYAALDNYVWCGSKKICEVECRYIVGAQPEEDTNAQLIATAGTTATKLAEQGYDAVKVLELLPELVRVIQDLPSDELIGEAVREALDQCRGEV